MRKNFFDNINDAVLYLIFLSLIPIASLMAQYVVGDRTMYLSFLIAGFSMTYDYFVLFRQNTCKRLFWEALIVTICLVAVIVLGMANLFLILVEDKVGKYTVSDYFIICILVIVLIVNIFEFILILIKEYRKKYPKSNIGNINSKNLMEGAKRV